MQSIDFYSDYKFCPECDQYVTYLMSVHTSYCTKCGGEVRLFSKEDWEKFNHSPNSRKGKKKQPKRPSVGFGRAQ